MGDQQVTRRDLIRSMATVGVLGGAAGAGAGYWAGGRRAPGGAAGGPRDPGGGSSASPGDALTVVGIFPLSGFVAADGQEMRNGVQMAVDEINALGGVGGRQLRLVVLDDVNSSAEEITTEFRRAVDKERADVIFSGYHIASGPEFDIVAQAGVPYYNVNTQERWTDLYKKDPQKYWSIFQCDPNDTWYGVGFALWLDALVKKGVYPAKARTVAILSGDDAYDKTIADTFEAKARELGWTESTPRQSFTAGKVSDWGPLLARVREKPPDVLFTTTYSPADNAAMAKALAARPLRSLVYQQYGPSVPEYMDLAGDAANGIIWGTVVGLLSDDKGRDFRARYQQKFGKPPGWSNAAACYDEVWLWAKAAALAGDARSYRKVAAASEAMIHRGVSGSISFEHHAGRQYPHQTRDASLGQPHLIVQIQDRRHRVVSPEPYTDAEFRLPPWFRA
jgi:branched-chain amino acid transport system substrate-binding protein